MTSSRTSCASGAVSRLRVVSRIRHLGPPTRSAVAPEQLPPLPAAVEVAVYRIALEALTNVARHAQARTCRIELSLHEGLQVVVADDGTGLAPDRSVGVGLASMRERAEELGGSCVVDQAPGGGARVTARLPLPEE